MSAAEIPQAAGRIATTLRLGVNIDHVATIRQARGVGYPDPVEAAIAAERGGASGITVHLREDRRHIQEHDVRRLLPIVTTKVNLEMAATEAMVELACAIRPADVCLVPEKREELTTEGGLAVAGRERMLEPVVARLREAGINVSLFIEPSAKEIEAAAAVGAAIVELHTGSYANAGPADVARELATIRYGAALAAGRGLQVNAGHGLTLENVAPVAVLPEIEELNIGHSIVARAIFVGIEEATREMLSVCLHARAGGPRP